MECTLATPNQAMSQSSLCLRSVRARSLLPAAPSSSGRLRSISTASRSGDARQLALRTTKRTGRLLQLGAELLSGKPLGELNLLSSSAWKANARSDTTLRDNVILMNAGWLHLAVSTGWLFLPGLAFGEEAVSGAASVVEQVGQSDAGVGIVDRVTGTGSGLDQVAVDKAVEAGAASADQVTAAGPAEPTDAFDAVASGAVSLLFVLAFLALLALTIGVVYLAVSEFREKKEAENEKQARGPVKKVEDLSTGVVKGKGFGKKVEKVAKEKSRK